MEEGSTGIQNDLQTSIKTSNNLKMSVLKGVDRTEYNQTHW